MGIRNEKTRLIAGSFVFCDQQSLFRSATAAGRFLLLLLFAGFAN